MKTPSRSLTIQKVETAQSTCLDPNAQMRCTTGRDPAGGKISLRNERERATLAGWVVRAQILIIAHSVSGLW